MLSYDVQLDRTRIVQVRITHRVVRIQITTRAVSVVGIAAKTEACFLSSFPTSLSRFSGRGPYAMTCRETTGFFSRGRTARYCILGARGVARPFIPTASALHFLADAPGQNQKSSGTKNPPRRSHTDNDASSKRSWNSRENGGLYGRGCQPWRSSSSC